MCVSPTLQQHISRAVVYAKSVVMLRQVYNSPPGTRLGKHITSVQNHMQGGSSRYKDIGVGGVAAV